MATYETLDQPLVVGKDWSIDVAITSAAAALTSLAPATGLTVTGYVAATATGASAVAATVAELTGVPGTYRVSVDGTAITANALGADGATVYVVLKVGTKVLRVYAATFYLSDRVG